MKRTLPGFLLALLALSACAAPGASPSGSTDASPGTSSPPDDAGTGRIEHPTGTEPILVVSSAGGFVPVEFMATQLPSFVLLGDGRVIMQGPQTLEFPGPAYPALVERTLTEEGIQAVLGTVEDTNLFTADLELRGAQNVVTDAADTLFMVDAGGQSVTVSIYGLGTLLPDMEPPPGLGSGEIEAHRILGQLNDGLMTLDSWLPADAWEAEGWQPFEPEAFRLYVRDVTGEPVEGDLPEQVREWPTADDPAAFGEEEEFFGDGTRCGLVDGDLAATWLRELAAANQMTLWTDDGDRRFRVMARPVLPHEDPACPELGGAA
ncbi:MAG: hypothetical protein M3153_11260 [Chloroflexota bacterium]|nr:hypothetical protein [Chloroflexota bacterium]